MFGGKHSRLEVRRTLSTFGECSHSSDPIANGQSKWSECKLPWNKVLDASHFSYLPCNQSRVFCLFLKSALEKPIHTYAVMKPYLMSLDKDRILAEDYVLTVVFLALLMKFGLLPH